MDFWEQAKRAIQKGAEKSPAGRLYDTYKDFTKKPDPGFGREYEPPTPEEEAASFSKMGDDFSLNSDEALKPQDVVMGKATTEEFKHDFNLRKTFKPVQNMSMEELEDIVQNGAWTPNQVGHPQWAAADEMLKIRKRHEKLSDAEKSMDVDWHKDNASQMAKLSVGSPLHAYSDTAAYAGFALQFPHMVAEEINFGKDETEFLNEWGEKALESSQEWRDWTHEVMQSREADNWLQEFTRVAPMAAVNPFKGQALVNGLVPNALELATPFTLGGGGGRVAANMAVQTLGREAFELALGREEENYRGFFEMPGMPGFGTPDFSNYVFPSAQAWSDDQDTNVRLSKIIGQNSAGVNITEGDRWLMGGMAALSIGVLFGPHAVRGAMKHGKPVYRRASHWITGKLPEEDTWKTFPHVDQTNQLAPHDLLDTSTWGQRAKAHLLGEADSLGYSLETMGMGSPKIRNLLYHNIGAQKHRSLDAAIDYGHMAGPDFEYKPQVIIGDFKRAYHALGSSIDGKNLSKQEFQEAWDLADRITIFRKEKLTKDGDTIPGWEGEMNYYETKQRFRELQDKYGKNLMKMLDYVLKSNRDIISVSKKGPYATWTNIDAQRAAQRPYYFHRRTPNQEDMYNLNGYIKKGFDGNKKIELGADDKLAPMQGLELMHRAALNSRIDNAVRGEVMNHLLSAQTVLKDRKAKFAVDITGRKLTDAQERNWGPKIVEWTENGKKRRVVVPQAWADSMKFSPQLALMPNLVTDINRFFQINTTGVLAPGFQQVRFFRDAQMLNLTAEPGTKRLGFGPNNMKLPGTQYLDSLFNGFVGPTFRAFQEEWYAAINKGLMDAGMFKYVPKDTLEWLGKIGAESFKRSTYYTAAAYGGIDSSHARRLFNEDHQDIVKSTRDYKKEVKWAQERAKAPGVRTAASLLGVLINNVGNAAPNASLFKNLRALRKEYGTMNDVPREKIIEASVNARRGTGDPAEFSRMWMYSGGRTKRLYGKDPKDSRPQNFLFRGDSTRISKLNEISTSWPGTLMHLLKEASPWTNAMVKGVEQTLRSWWARPTQTGMRFAAQYLVPITGTYTAALMMGKDPNGISYFDHMMHRRSDYEKASYIYFPIPGKPAEEGLQIPMGLEHAPLGYMYLNALDWLVRPAEQDRERVGAVMAETFFDMVMPIPAQMGAALAGSKIGGGIFFDTDSYSTKYKGEDGLSRFARDRLMAAGREPKDAEEEVARYQAAARAAFGGMYTVWFGTVGAMVDRNILEEAREEELSTLDKVVDTAKVGGEQFFGSLSGKFKTLSGTTQIGHNEITDKYWEVLKYSGRIYDGWVATKFNQDEHGKPQHREGAVKVTKGRQYTQIAAPIKDVPGMISPPTIDFKEVPLARLKGKGPDGKTAFIEDKHGRTNMDNRIYAAPDGTFYVVPVLNQKGEQNVVSYGKKGERFSKAKDIVPGFTTNHYGQFATREAASAYGKELIRLRQQADIVKAPDTREVIPEQDATRAGKRFDMPKNRAWMFWNKDIHNAIGKTPNKKLTSDFFAAKTLVDDARKINAATADWYKKRIETMGEGPNKDFMMAVTKDGISEVERRKLIYHFEQQLITHYRRRIQKSEAMLAQIEAEVYAATGERVKVKLKDLDPWGFTPDWFKKMKPDYETSVPMRFGED